MAGDLFAASFLAEVNIAAVNRCVLGELVSGVDHEADRSSPRRRQTSSGTRRNGNAKNTKSAPAACSTITAQAASPRSATRSVRLSRTRLLLRYIGIWCSDQVVQRPSGAPTPG